MSSRPPPPPTASGFPLRKLCIAKSPASPTSRADLCVHWGTRPTWACLILFLLTQFPPGLKEWDWGLKEWHVRGQWQHEYREMVPPRTNYMRTLLHSCSAPDLKMNWGYIDQEDESDSKRARIQHHLCLTHTPDLSPSTPRCFNRCAPLE